MARREDRGRVAGSHTCESTADRPTKAEEGKTTPMPDQARRRCCALDGEQKVRLAPNIALDAVPDYDGDLPPHAFFCRDYAPESLWDVLATPRRDSTPASVSNLKI